MVMKHKFFQYFLAISMAIITIIGVTQIVGLKESLIETELELTQLKTENYELQETVINLNESVHNLRNELNVTKTSNEALRDALYRLDGEYDLLDEENILLDDAIDIIGRAEVETLLIAYSEKVRELEKIKQDYNQLLDSYNELLQAQ
jgi:hypothetical protein